MTVNYALGTNISTNSTFGFADAISAAEKSDVIIYAGGIDNTIEAEGMDRDNINWPGNQLNLIQKLSKLGKPVVVLQMGGGQVDSSSLKSNEHINSLIWGGYPGQSGGAALRDIILGKRTPAGRLTATQYPADYIYQFDQLDMDLAPHGTCPGQTYMYYTGHAVYEFGYGIFYTTFEEKLEMNGTATSYNITKLFAEAHSAYEYAEQRPLLDFQFTVTNTGEIASEYSAMLFASSTSGPSPRPIKWLVGIDREASIASGHSHLVSITVPIGTLARADINGNLVVYPGHYELALNTDRSLIYSFELTGNAVTIEKWPLPYQQIPPATGLKVQEKDTHTIL